MSLNTSVAEWQSQYYCPLLPNSICPILLDPACYAVLLVTVIIGSKMLNIAIAPRLFFSGLWKWTTNKILSVHQVSIKRHTGFTATTRFIITRWKQSKVVDYSWRRHESAFFLAWHAETWVRFYPPHFMSGNASRRITSSSFMKIVTQLGFVIYNWTSI